MHLLGFTSPFGPLPCRQENLPSWLAAPRRMRNMWSWASWPTHRAAAKSRTVQRDQEMQATPHEWAQPRAAESSQPTSTSLRMSDYDGYNTNCGDICYVALFWQHQNTYWNMRTSAACALLSPSRPYFSRIPQGMYYFFIVIHFKLFSYWLIF